MLAHAQRFFSIHHRQTAEEAKTAETPEWIVGPTGNENQNDLFAHEEQPRTLFYY